MAETAPIQLVRYYSFFFALIDTILDNLKLRRGVGVLNRAPGPWTLPVVGNMHNLLGALPHQSMHRLAQRHGPAMLLRLGHVYTLVLSSAQAAREVEVHGAAFADRPEYSTTGIFRGQNISLAELLGPMGIGSFRRVREEEAARLVINISTRMSYIGPVLVDISEMVTDMMNDVFMRVSVGEMVKPMTHKFLDRIFVGDRYPQWAAYIEELDRAMSLMSGLDLTDLFPTSRLARALGRRSQRARRQARRRIQFIVDAMICYHRAAMEEADGAGRDDQREDILTALLRLQSDAGTSGVTLTNEDISGILFDIFSAGSRMATTIIWAMSELMKSPRIMAIAQSEVRRILKGKVVSEANIHGQLHYLKMVIRETLRLHPPVPLLNPMSCTKPSKIMGYDVPRGTTVLVNMWAIGRDEQNWADASEFKPERFEGKKVDYGDLDTSFLPAGVDPRMCPGMMFGVSIIEITLANLLDNFDWNLAQGGDPQELDMAETYAITTHRRTPLMLTATAHFGTS